MKTRYPALISAIVLAIPLASFAQGALAQPPARGDQTQPRDVGRVIDDTAITAKVKGEFVKDKEVNALAVAVTTRNGDVQLSGRAKNQLVADKAVALARAVPGVKSVSSAIEIRPN